MKFSNSLFFALCAATLQLSSYAADTQPYPSRPIRIVVPYLPGGAGDVVARTIAPKMGESLGQQTYIDNRPGGATKIGTEAAARAPGDGYTLFMATPASAVNVSLYTEMPYDLVRDFAPVVLIDISPQVLIVHPSLPVKSVKDLIALGKSQPGQLTFASSGIAGSVHLAGELFKSMARIDVVHIPYKGFAQALTDLLSGQVTMNFSTLQSALPHIKANRIRALAVTSARRSATQPDLPTIAEAALPGYEMVVWHALLAPAATPPEIIHRLNGEVLKALKLADVRRQLESVGVELVGSTPAELGAYVKTEIAKYARLVKNANIRPE
jgi:tripartite-type tricarboxylate transporter receptor subunit TctC